MANKEDMQFVFKHPVPAEDWGTLAEWCDHYFGNNWYWGFREIGLANEKDRNLFVLRWGHSDSDIS